MTETVFVKSVKYLYHERKLNVIPFDTENRGNVLPTYKEYQNKRIPLTVFNEWIENGLLEKGMTIFPDKIYLDNNGEWYWVTFDFDSKKATDEFCSIFGNEISLKELSKRFSVEQYGSTGRNKETPTWLKFQSCRKGLGGFLNPW